MNKKKDLQNKIKKSTSRKKKGRWSRFLERLAETNKKDSVTGCRD